MATEIDLSQFHEVFFEESFEGLAVMESGLLGLNINNPDSEIINNVFRAAHSIKGGSGTFGFLEVADFTHIMESILDDIRSSDLRLSDAVIQLLLESVDYLKHMLSECQADRTVPQDETKTFMKRLSDFRAAPHDQVTTTPPATAPKSADPTESSGVEKNQQSDAKATQTWQIGLKSDPGLFKSGIDPFRLIREVALLGKLTTELDVSNLPEFETLDPEDCHLSWQMNLTESEAREEDITEIFEWIEGNSELTVTQAAPLIAEPDSEEQATTNIVAASQLKPEAAYIIPEVSSIRVNIDRIDMLVNLVGELVITQSMLSRFKEGVSHEDLSEFARGIEQLEENARELQEHTMQIRMLPIDNVFQRMPRLVRDLSKSLNKEVQLIMNGKSTEVDRTVLEKISDPLTHLIRNCLDHGIETPEERIINGKPPTGKVEISAFHEGGNIIIEVKDDGAGLNRKAIRAKAIEKGIIEADAELTDGQIDQLIFYPGFSTAETISDVSGRGVGMDVVKNNIEQINGHINLQSTPGEGSCFSIRLPLTLAIIEGQLVRVGTDILIVPLLSIVKSTRIHPDEYNMVAGESGMFRLEDNYIPVIPLNDIYNIEADYKNVDDAILVIVDAVERFGLLVDEVLGQQQVVVKSLETNFKQVPTISGATILGDGTVAMILDMAGLLKKFKSERQ